MKIQTEANIIPGLSNQTMRVQIGEICCAINCSDSKVFDSLRGLFKNFLSNQPDDISLELCEIEQLSQSEIETIMSKTGYIHKKNLLRAISRITDTEDFSNSKTGISAEKDTINPNLEFRHLNRLLSQAFYSACKEKHNVNLPAMLVHACGILRREQALVFTGPKEAGKTTIARLCGKRDGEVINDEMILISRPRSNGDCMNVQSTPIISRFSPRRNITAPLRYIMLLRKSNKTSVHRLDRTQAYLQFMRQIIAPASMSHTDKRAFLSLMADFSDEVTRTIPFFELEFNLDAESLWRVVDEIKDI